MATPDDYDGTGSDPRLTAILQDGHHPDFLEWRDLAKAAIDSPDLQGFWLQAVGDGTPLSGIESNLVDPWPGFPIAFATGLRDDFEFPKEFLEGAPPDRHVFDPIATFLNHVLGVIPADEDLPRRVILLEDALTEIHRGTEFYLQQADPIEARPTDPIDFETQLERARTLLDHEALTVFWLYTIDDGDDPVITPETATPLEEFPIRTSVLEQVTTITGVPPTFDRYEFHDVTLAFLAHHLFVAAVLIEEPPDELITSMYGLVRLYWRQAEEDAAV